MLSKIKLHPLQEERLNVDEWYRKERDNLENLRRQKLNDIQDKCTHKWGEDLDAWDYTSQPFSETFCVICHKFR